MITVEPNYDGHAEVVAELRMILAMVETVDSYAVDYLTPEGVIDADSFSRERVGDLTRVLGELDAIRDATIPYDRPIFGLAVRAARRAHMLGDAIREAMGQPVTTMTYDRSAVSIEDTIPRSPFAPKSAASHVGLGE